MANQSEMNWDKILREIYTVGRDGETIRLPKLAGWRRYSPLAASAAASCSSVEVVELPGKRDLQAVYELLIEAFLETNDG